MMTSKQVHMYFNSTVLLCRIKLLPVQNVQVVICPLSCSHKIHTKRAQSEFSVKLLKSRPIHSPVNLSSLICTHPKQPLHIQMMGGQVSRSIYLCNAVIMISWDSRDLYRIKLLPVTHVLVDTWMLTVKPIYKLSNVPDDLKWATNTHMTPFTLTFKAN